MPAAPHPPSGSAPVCPTPSEGSRPTRRPGRTGPASSRAQRPGSTAGYAPPTARRATNRRGCGAAGSRVASREHSRSLPEPSPGPCLHYIPEVRFCPVRNPETPLETSHIEGQKKLQAPPSAELGLAIASSASDKSHLGVAVRVNGPRISRELHARGPLRARRDHLVLKFTTEAFGLLYISPQRIAPKEIHLWPLLHEKHGRNRA